MKTGATRIMLLTGLLASGGSVFCFSPVLAASDNSNREARIESRREAGETNDEQSVWQHEENRFRDRLLANIKLDGEIDRFAGNAKLMSEIGVDETTQKKLRTELMAVRKRYVELNEQITKRSMEQADQMGKFMQSPTVGTSNLMTLVEEIGTLRTEQAKCSLQRLMIVRKYLTSEQMAKVRQAMREREPKHEARAGEKGERRERVPGNVPPAVQPDASRSPGRTNNAAQSPSLP
jgi:hypothetical protein